MGKKAPYAMISTFDSSSIPNHRIASGISAIGGIGRSSSSSGSRMPRTIGDTPIATPSGTALTSAIAKPSITRSRLALT